VKRFVLLAALFSSVALAQAPPPVINQVTTTAPAFPGSVVYIAGSGLTGATAVNLGAATDGAFSVVSDTQINYTVPVDGVPGGTITVATPAGTASSSSSVTVIPFASAAPPCLPNTGNVNTLLNPSTGNTIVGLWCDVASGTYRYAVSGNTNPASWQQSNCLKGVAPFSVSLQWLTQAYAACVNFVMLPSDQAYAGRLAFQFVPRPTLKGTGPQTIFTTAKNGGLGSPLILGTPPAFQTIAGGTVVGGLRLPGGNVTRYCSVSGYTSDQGNLIPAGSYVGCTLVFPPTGGFKYPTSADKANVTAVSDAILVDGAHHLWGIDSHSIITVDGIEDASSSNVVQIAYVGGLIWQRNANNLWFSKTDPSAPWLPVGGSATSPLPPP
jgi:hypothetical protein